MNEELLTLNIELQNKIADFLAIESDMKNLLNSTNIATLFLDKELNIKKFTPNLTHIIKLRPNDVGRPLTELSIDLKNLNIIDSSREVMRTLAANETDILTNEGEWYMVRIMPYNTTDEIINGVVITFVDITTAKNLEAQIAASNIEEKEKRLRELTVANIELAFQNKENQKRAEELILANKELTFQNKNMKNLKAELEKAIKILREHNLYQP
jgi:two-component system CheB/CheR fusion protein